MHLPPLSQPGPGRSVGITTTGKMEVSRNAFAHLVPVLPGATVNALGRSGFLNLLLLRLLLGEDGGRLNRRELLQVLFRRRRRRRRRQEQGEGETLHAVVVAVALAVAVLPRDRAVAVAGGSSASLFLLVGRSLVE